MNGWTFSPNPCKRGKSRHHHLLTTPLLGTRGFCYLWRYWMLWPGLPLFLQCCSKFEPSGLFDPGSWNFGRIKKTKGICLAPLLRMSLNWYSAGSFEAWYSYLQHHLYLSVVIGMTILFVCLNVDILNMLLKNSAHAATKVFTLSQQS